MSQDDFTFDKDFWPIAKRWRGRFSNPKRGRDGAEPAWNRCVKEGADPEQICTGARGYVAHIEKDGVEPQHVCQARTFLNQWRWEQYVELAIETEKQDAEDMLERRRNYWRYGWRDEARGQELSHGTDGMQPEVLEAYEQGRQAYRDQVPQLRVAG